MRFEPDTVARLTEQLARCRAELGADICFLLDDRDEIVAHSGEADTDQSHRLAGMDVGGSSASEVLKRGEPVLSIHRGLGIASVGQELVLIAIHTDEDAEMRGAIETCAEGLQNIIANPPPPNEVA